MKDYDGYNFKKYQELAQDDKLSMYEKIGFPDAYREHSENLIFNNILLKLPLLKEKESLKVLDIGSGCSNLQKHISNFCFKHKHKLFLSDSQEMLDLIDDRENEVKIAGLFPDETFAKIKEKTGGVDIIICYSVLHYIFVDSNVWYFLDCIMELLNDGGQILIGDIPNVSKRKRFFASNNGIKFHQKFMQTNELPKVEFNCIEKGKIDDSLLHSIVLKCQASGFDAYIVPQAKDLPFANRRDDIIIRKP